MLMRKCVPFVLLIVAVVLCGTFPLVSMAAQQVEGTQTAQEQSVSASPAGVDASQAKININSASAVELEKLPGIGSKISQEIVKYREANGPFKAIEDLKKVKGVGEKKFDSIKDKISV